VVVGAIARLDVEVGSAPRRVSQCRVFQHFDVFLRIPVLQALCLQLVSRFRRRQRIFHLRLALRVRTGVSCLEAVLREVWVCRVDAV
jgi:hypothetical protein